MEEKEKEEEKVGTRIRLGLKPNRRIKKKFPSFFQKNIFGYAFFMGFFHDFEGK